MGEVVETRMLARRRALFLAAALILGGGLLNTMLLVLMTDGLDLTDLALLACFALMLPWNVINFLNALAGLALLALSRQPDARVFPDLARDDPARPVRGRTAIVMPIHNEDPARVLRHLTATMRSLQATGGIAAFELHVLSDTTEPELLAGEQRMMEQLCAALEQPDLVHYRHRAHNVDAKTGNIAEFLGRAGARFDYMLVLDADSLMTGAAILRLVRLMDEDARLGILQTLVVGLPTGSAFARLFQYGMRHGMRAFTMGAAWWQGSSGPYWGHNALIRVAPFMAHCRLPHLSGRPPFGGMILSHDQVEAVMMRRAGYTVRVIPDESGSFEENPPTLPDFLKRDLRWCQGNMQYARLLHLPGLRRMGRVQLALAMLMYLQAPAWLLFVLISTFRPLLPGLHLTQAALPAAGHPFAAGLGIVLFAATLFMVMAPKLCSIAQTLLSPAQRRRYGGAGRVLGSAFAELVFSTLLMPTLATVQSLFMLKLCFGRTRIWSAQRRTSTGIGLLEAVSELRACLVLGACLALGAWFLVPAALPYLVPVAGGLLLGPLLAWVTALPAAGRLMQRAGVCAIPEELSLLPEIVEAGHGPQPLEDTRDVPLLAGRGPLSRLPSEP